MNCLRDNAPINSPAACLTRWRALSSNWTRASPAARFFARRSPADPTMTRPKLQTRGISSGHNPAHCAASLQPASCSAASSATTRQHCSQGCLREGTCRAVALPPTSSRKTFAGILMDGPSPPARVRPLIAVRKYVFRHKAGVAGADDRLSNSRDQHGGNSARGSHRAKE